MAELYFHCFLHFDCVPVYIFGFHHKQWASDQKDFTSVKFTSQLLSSADESLKDETHLLLLRDGLLVTLQTLCSYIPSVVKPMHIFMAKSRVSKSCLMAELCFHRFVHFYCVPTYIFGFHYKQCASDQKDFNSVKFTSQLFSSTNESLKDKTCLILLL